MAIPIQEELDWAKKYPIPNATVEDIVISLWNYPVARTDLPPEHQAALKKFLAGDFLHVKLAGSTETVLIVTGHASDSGEGPSNVTRSGAKSSAFSHQRGISFIANPCGVGRRK